MCGLMRIRCTGAVFPTAVALLSALCLTALAGSAHAQAAMQDDPMALAATPRPTAGAVRAAGTLVVDGVLNEEDWQKATAVSHFLQAEPLPGQAASENTEVRVLYDDVAMYVGVWLADANPAGIVTTSERRDAFLGDQDSFQVVFDTFRDRQNGFVFGTNASGVQYDAQIRNQVTNVSWDGSWEVQTRRSENGWTAEFRIPLRTLRYGPSPQTWGVNFTRQIQRTRERTYWAPLPRQFEIQRLSSAGELRGLTLKTPRNLKILPYAVGSADRTFATRRPTITNGEFGVDAKVGLTAGLNLDLTYNTDFAQVEVDNQQINLTRFNIRFPEKRPFFLENSGLFTVGATASGMVSSGDLDLFFSRRIGLDEQGGLVPIIGGGRLSGKTSGYNVGLLNMQTDSVGLAPGNNFTVARVSKDLRRRSGIGGIFINRSATGDRAGDDNWNRTWGVDGRLGAGERLTVGAFAARTETPGLTGREHAWNMASEYNDGKTQLNFDFGQVGEDFNPEVGYLQNTFGYRRWFMRVQETLRQQRVRKWGFRELLPHMTYTRYDYLDSGELQNAELHIDNHWDWENGNYIATAVNGTWEGLRAPFTLFPGVVVPPGQVGGVRFTLRSNTDRRRPVFLRHQWDVGRFYTGTQNSQQVQTILRQGGSFLFDMTWTHRRIDLPQGDFQTNLGSVRITQNFTPSVFVQSLIQYNDATHRWSTNLRFHWLETAGTGLFVVYNDTESLEGLGPVNRSFIVKYVKQFDLLR
jgi:hypothetical protein